jgi:hypothetical protein
MCWDEVKTKCLSHPCPALLRRYCTRPAVCRLRAQPCLFNHQTITPSMHLPDEHSEDARVRWFDDSQRGPELPSRCREYHGSVSFRRLRTQRSNVPPAESCAATKNVAWV